MPIFTVSGTPCPAKEGVYPAFQGSAIAPLPDGNGYAALPIGARLYLNSPLRVADFAYCP